MASKLPNVLSITARSTLLDKCDDGIPPSDLPKTPTFPVIFKLLRKYSYTRSTSVFRFYGDGLPVD